MALDILGLMGGGKEKGASKATIILLLRALADEMERDDVEDPNAPGPMWQPDAPFAEPEVRVRTHWEPY